MILSRTPVPCPPRKSPWFSWSLVTGRGLLTSLPTMQIQFHNLIDMHVIQFRTHHRTCEDACKTGTSKHEIRMRVFFPLISCNYIKGMRVLFSCCSYSDTYFKFWGVVRCVDMVTHAWKRLKYVFKIYQLFHTQEWTWLEDLCIPLQQTCTLNNQNLISGGLFFFLMLQHKLATATEVLLCNLIGRSWRTWKLNRITIHIPYLESR